MSRKAPDSRLDTRNARRALKQQREPYWRTIRTGVAVGYRKGARGGTWIARHYTPETGRRFEALGPADDYADANGSTVLDFGQAQAAADKWFAQIEREDAGGVTAGPYTVTEALKDYLDHYEARGGKAKSQTSATIEAHIKPGLGSHDIAKLRRPQVQKWFHDLAQTRARLRTKKDKEQEHRKAAADDEAKRKRRATANRCLTVLKAALNLAKHNGRIASDDAWAGVKAFREVDAPVVRYLTEAEAKRLSNACDVHFRPMVQAALLTGCRYGELAALVASDYNDDAGVVMVRLSKGGKKRAVVLTDEGKQFFTQATAGKAGHVRLFSTKGGAAWGKSHQQKPLSRACKAAKISPAISFHVLRHTHGSTLAMKGVPMGVIAAQLGHAGTRMTEKHYAHLSPSYVAETIRENFPKLGIVPKSNVRSIGKR